MKISVWDTYVKKPDGRMMHFDILAPHHLNDKDKIYNFGKSYLESKGLNNLDLTTRECRFCHMEEASIEVEESISINGFFIIELENCN